MCEMTIWGALFVSLLTLAAAGQGQPPATPARDSPAVPLAGDGVIAGRVTLDGEPVEPVRRAILTLRGSAMTAGWTTIAGEDGTFEFKQVPAGLFTLTASKPGLPTIHYGAHRAGRPGLLIPLAAGQRTTTLRVIMQRGATISGTLMDETGSPVQAAVQLLRIVARGGLPTSQPVSQVKSEDDGSYRFYGLAAGEYIVSVPSERRGAPASVVRYSASDLDALVSTGAAAGIPRPVTVPTVYYPSAVDWMDATHLRVGPGESVVGVDIRQRTVPVVSVSGVISDSLGRHGDDFIVNLSRVGGGQAPLTGPQRPSKSGQFTFAGLTAGRYVVTARGATEDAATSSWARAVVDISDADITGLQLVMANGVSVAGVVTFEDGQQSATVRLRLSAVLADGDVAVGVPDVAPKPDGAFTFVGVPPGRYRLSVAGSGAAGGTPLLKRAVRGNDDLFNVPFEVGNTDVQGVRLTFSNHLAGLVGSFVASDERPAESFYVIVFPSNDTYWFQGSPLIRAARPSADGGFSMADLPAGSYLVGAVVDVEDGEWFDAQFLKQLAPSATPVALRDGQTVRVSLKIGGA